MESVDHLYFADWKDVSKERFEYIVIGGGAYGTSFAYRMLALDAQCKVLIVDKGGYLIPDHIQNLPPEYVDLNTTVGSRPWKATGDMDFMPQVPYLGGRALFWNAWIPQPSREEMPGWPSSVIQALKKEWIPAEEFIGRRYSLKLPGNDNTEITNLVQQRLFRDLSKIDTAFPTERPCELDSSMAAGQGVPPTEFAKFSPISILVALSQKYRDRFKVMPNCEALRLTVQGGRAIELHTTLGSLPLDQSKVVLALSTLEAAALIVRSLRDNPLVGKNLSGHYRSWLAFRVARKFYSRLTERFQSTAFYLPGWDEKLNRFMHTHISAVYNPRPNVDLALLYRTLPDASSAATVATYQDPGYVVYMLHAMGEFLGEPTANSWNYVKLDGDQMIVNVSFQPDDKAFWNVMDRTVDQIVDVLSAGDAVEFQQTDGTWGPSPPASIRNKGLVHESGTLWMGDSRNSSVTNADGSIYDATNVYGTGGMLFPRPGSWNPTYTGIAMAFAMARRFA
jgi:GMC oxidoreductase